MTDSEANMESTLWYIFNNVNRWLEHAEKKNMVLLTVMALQLTLMKTLVATTSIWLILAYVSLGLCFLINLISFLPVTEIPKWLYSWSDAISPPAENDNLLFFMHISKYSLPDYIASLQKLLGSEITNKYYENICSQIVINSIIAASKYRMFKVSFWFMIAGQILFLFSFF
jgi:hypothetical protein